MRRSPWIGPAAVLLAAAATHGVVRVTAAPFDAAAWRAGDLEARYAMFLSLRRAHDFHGLTRERISERLGPPFIADARRMSYIAQEADTGRWRGLHLWLDARGVCEDVTILGADPWPVEPVRRLLHRWWR
ncbi:MAG: hypothetical protein ACF8XB_19180 [Planctomycetota bacterium JB042]